jgi:hypothetical protein
MNYHEKISYLRSKLAEQGVEEWRVIPVYFVVWWSVGLHPAPPVFLGLWRYLAVYSPMTILSVVTVFTILTQRLPTTLSDLVTCGLAYLGCLLVAALNLQRLRRRLRLPFYNWKEYPGESD